MTTNRKVIWGEGMFLTPQHFQHWDQYYDTLLSERLRILNPFDWGVTELDIDRDGLVNGRFSLLGFRGVMPDGLVVHVPTHDEPPPTRAVGELFPPAMERLDVFIGVPVERLGAANCKLDLSSSARPERYSAEYSKRPDANTGENTRDILVARKNLKLFFSGEEMTDTVAFKIAELVRSPAGTIGLRDTYIPPCLYISASPYLIRLTRALLELLTAKSNSFSGTQRSVLEVIGSDLAKFSLVHTLFAHIPRLTHVCQVQKVHPEALYLLMAHLAGELMMVADPAEPREVPRYQHDDLFATFSEMDRKIRAIVEGVTPTRYFSIPLKAGGENVLVGRVDDNRLFVSCQFFLMATGDHFQEDQVRTMVPHHLRIGSLSKLKEIVAAAMPGVRIYHLPRPPSSLPAKAKYQYFRLDTHGVFWDEIRQTQDIALHVPETLKGLQIELLAAKE